MQITAQLQRFVDDELARSEPLAEETVKLVVGQLLQRREGDSSERARAFELGQLLREKSSLFVRSFSNALSDVVRSDMQAVHPVERAPTTARGLELMDETRVEADIEVAGAAQVLLNAAEWELRELQTFTSTLAGQQHVSNDTNPLQPQAYARALWSASSAVAADRERRAAVLRATAHAMSGLLKKAWAAACTRLEGQGVEPGIYRTVVLAPGAKVDRAPHFDLTQPGMLEALLPRMPFSSAGAHGGTPAARDRGVRPVQPGLDAALARFELLLERTASQVGGSGQGPRLADHRDALMSSTPDTVDRQIVELLSRLFEDILADSRLPAPFRGVMARLQVSALRVALADPVMLDSHEHPVWRLINRIGSAAETYARATDPRCEALLAYCEKLVNEMAQAPVQDAMLYRLGLARLEAFLTDQLREQQQRAQPTIDSLARAEQRDALQAQIAQRLHDQLQPIRATVVLRRCICGVWAKALAESMIRHGEKAEETLEYLRATDDLLWSLRLPDHPQSRKRLLAMLPGLLHKLRTGMAMASVPADDQQTFLDELMAVHTEALRPGAQAGAAAPALSPEQIVQRLREETEWAPSSRPPFSESLLDLGSMETVPAELLPATQGDSEQAQLQVEVMPVGSRHHLFLHGRWTRVQLLWRSAQGEFFLFAGPDPEHAHSITRRALERLSEEGLLKPLEDVSLVQRAVDHLMQKLASPV